MRRHTSGPRSGRFSWIADSNRMLVRRRESRVDGDGLVENLECLGGGGSSERRLVWWYTASANERLTTSGSSG